MYLKLLLDIAQQIVLHRIFQFPNNILLQMLLALFYFMDHFSNYLDLLNLF